MLTPEQIQERVNYIGGSDAAAVLGLSRWQTPLQIWAIKTGQVVPEDISGKMPVRLGNKLEDTVAELFTEDTGLKVRRVNETIYHPVYPFLAVNLDRRIVGQDAFAEFKVRSVFKAKEYEGEGMIPQEDIIQCYHGLAVTGYQKAYLAVLIGNQELIIKEIVRDEKVLNDMVAKEVYFWKEFVEKKIMPGVMADDNKTLCRLFPHAQEGQIIELTDEVNRMCENLEALNQDKFVTEKLIEKIRNDLKARIKDNEVGTTGNYQIKWCNVHKDEYTVKASDFRSLRIKKLKGGVNDNNG